ncbi:hypothetical protein WJX72_009560 [[Myrmecia] bisecta]|uniref:Transcription initiation factor IIE subunit beta n=1 Tax=[Myrmecia] bisecta TaxID=41462 RepID=A0AAW1QCB9_9CHLO
MSNLQRELEKFRKQQLAGSQLLASATQKRAAAPKRESKPRAPGRGRGRGAAAATGMPGRPQPDTKTLLRTGTGRKDAVPVGKHIKDVLDFLKVERRPLSADEILQAKNVNIVPGAELYDELKNHQRVRVTAEGLFEYKALHDLQDKQELLQLLQKAPEGTHAGDVKDAYIGVMDDIAALRQEGRLIVMPCWETQDNVLYPTDPKMESFSIDQDIVDLWYNIKVPEDPVEVEAELRKASIQAAPRKAVRKRVAGGKRERKKREYRPRVVTNVHMPELFMAPAPTQID